MTGTTRTVGGANLKVGKAVFNDSEMIAAINACTAEVAKQHLKKIPPPVVHNEIINEKPTVINKVDTPSVEVECPVHVSINVDQLEKTLRRFIWAIPLQIAVWAVIVGVLVPWMNQLASRLLYP